MKHQNLSSSSLFLERDQFPPSRVVGQVRMEAWKEEEGPFICV